jgi:hypothetical protein
MQKFQNNSNAMSKFSLHAEKIIVGVSQKKPDRYANYSLLDDLEQIQERQGGELSSSIAVSPRLKGKKTDISTPDEEYTFNSISIKNQVKAMKLHGTTNLDTFSGPHKLRATLEKIEKKISPFKHGGATTLYRIPTSMYGSK